MPEHKLNTPEMRLTLVMLATVAYTFSPILFAAFMFKLLNEGAFPTNADSIGLPIAGFVFLWLLLWPFFILACFLFEKVGQRIARNRGVELREQNETAGVK